ncbi:glycosyl hydrolase family 28 protein [Hymenobacter sp. H14-R3]|uniref:glycosyl hydrolase family 28 protein n=1 Tax=Hymenobacter sp. H14-R3 TaxID=3046308 RepID=UPI0024BA8CC4|nr:glycosyl hydrolase family 28 protein [Hymenobacter sp. H14-R3]MDJ0365002.1 glycosyl hydrolase family 28 protein [Hymenobacter sp. H14-R3]
MPSLLRPARRPGGVLSADGKIWWPSRETLVKKLKANTNTTETNCRPARDYLRLKMVVITNSQNLLLDGPTSRNSPLFVINPKGITNLIIRNVQLHNDFWDHNGNAINIGASHNVVIYPCMVSGSCIKSSGGNADGSMRNVWATDCRFIGTDIGGRVKSNAGRGGRVRGIYVDNVIMANTLHEAILFNASYEDVPTGKENGSGLPVTATKVPGFQQFYRKNITYKSAETAIYFQGLPE